MKTNTPLLQAPIAPVSVVRLFASAQSWIEGDAVRQLYATAKLDGVRLAVGFPDLHPGNPKLQAPEKHQAPKFKGAIVRRWSFGAFWSLVLGSSQQFGCWCLEFSFVRECKAARAAGLSSRATAVRDREQSTLGIHIAELGKPNRCEPDHGCQFQMRNPKVEIRKKPEAEPRIGPCDAYGLWLGISDFFRVSGFGFRVSDYENPKGISFTQPRVARNELPWVTVKPTSQL